MSETEREGEAGRVCERALHSSLKTEAAIKFWSHDEGHLISKIKLSDKISQLH